MKQRFGTLSLVLLFLTVIFVSPYARAAGIAAQKLDAAAAAFEKEDWATAAKLYRELATDNPVNGMFWYQLGTAEYNLKNYRESIAAYGRAIDVGHLVGVSYYNQACCYALLGETKPAVDALDHAIKSGLRNREEMIRTDEDFKSIRNTPEFQKRILPDPPLDISRVDGWRMDLDYLTKRVAETHYDPWAHISRAEWDKEITRISKAVPEMKDYQIIVAMVQLMVRLGDGHTGLAAPRNGKYAFHRLPVVFYDFKDGLFIKTAAPDYASLVGQKVVRIGDLATKDAMARIKTTAQRDNDQGARWMGPRYLTRIEYLDALGISKGLDAVELTLVDANGKETRTTLKPIPFPGDNPHDQEVIPDNWIDMAPKTEPLPMWRKEPDRYFTVDYLDDSKIVYANFRAVLDSQHETLADFAKRTVDLAEEKKARALVIDVRLNNGGNNNLARPFLYAIAGSSFNQAGKLFLITGRETFSACQNFSTWMDRGTAAMFVGEPTGSSPNFVGEGNEIRLPYSGLMANASSRMWQDSYSEDRRVWIAPELAAEMTSDDYRTNRDPALAAILDYLAMRETARP